MAMVATHATHMPFFAAVVAGDLPWSTTVLGHMIFISTVATGSLLAVGTILRQESVE
jgi:hypothetical protein